MFFRGWRAAAPRLPVIARFYGAGRQAPAQQLVDEPEFESLPEPEVAGRGVA
jgi:hypothetical protein